MSRAADNINLDKVKASAIQGGLELQLKGYGTRTCGVCGGSGMAEVTQNEHEMSTVRRLDVLESTG